MKVSKILLIFLAVSLFGAACNKQPESFEDLRSAGQRAFLDGKMLESRGYFNEALKKRPSDRDLLYYLGRVYLAEHMYDSAHFFLKRAALLNRDDREVNRALHEAATRTESWQDAIDAVRSLIRTGDRVEDHYLKLAQYGLADSIGPVAFYYYGKLREQYPDSMEYYLRQAESAIIKDTLVAALDILEEAIDRFGDKIELLADIGVYYTLAQRHSRAEETFRKLVARDTSIVLKLNLATSLSLNESKAKKREALEMFTELRPKAIDKDRIDSIITLLNNDLK